MKRLLYILLIYVFYAPAFAGDFTWTLRSDGCWYDDTGTWYAFVAEVQGDHAERLHWSSGSDAGSINLSPRLRLAITTADPELTAWIGNDSRTVYNDSECIPGPPAQPEPELIMVTLPEYQETVLWSCYGGPFEHLTPVDTVLLFNAQTQQLEPSYISVLPMDTYWEPDAAACQIQNEGQYWYLVGRETLNCVLYRQRTEGCSVTVVDLH